MQIPKQIPSLTGIRGIAAVWVVLLHYEGQFSALLPAWHYGDFIWVRGHQAVPLFFLLSGFILAHVYKAREFDLSPRSYGVFIWHRLLRLYPVHVFTLFILLALVVLGSVLRIQMSGDYRAMPLIYNLFLIQTFPMIPGAGWNYPSWSISVEWFAYIFAFPVGCLLLRAGFLRNIALNLTFIAVSMAMAVLFANVTWFLNAPGILVGVALFLGGMLLYSYVEKLKELRFYRYAGTCGILVSAGLFYFAPDSVCRPFFILITPLILIECLSEESGLSRFFSLSAVVYLGEISYSLYMTHGVAIKFLKIVLPASRFVNYSLPIRFAVFSVYIVVIAIAAIATYHLVERKARLVLRRAYG